MKIRLNRNTRIFLQRVMLRLFKEVECKTHFVGEVTYDEAGNAYSNCQLCDTPMTLVEKLLRDVDTMRCGEIDRLLPKGLTMDEFILSANKRSGLIKDTNE